MRQPLIALTVAVFLGGCAANTAALPQERDIGRDRDEVLRQRLDTTGIPVVLPLDPVKVWAVLPGAYAALGLAPVEVDGAGSRIGVRNVRVHGRLQGADMAQYLDCGASRVGAPNASTYEVRMTLLTSFAGDGRRSSRLWTALIAEANNPLSGSSQRVLCYSNGSLEAKLHAEIERRAAP